MFRVPSLAAVLRECRISEIKLGYGKIKKFHKLVKMSVKTNSQTWMEPLANF